MILIQVGEFPPHPSLAPSCLQKTELLQSGNLLRSPLRDPLSSSLAFTLKLADASLYLTEFFLNTSSRVTNTLFNSSHKTFRLDNAGDLSLLQQRQPSSCLLLSSPLFSVPLVGDNGESPRGGGGKRAGGGGGGAHSCRSTCQTPPPRATRAASQVWPEPKSL